MNAVLKGILERCPHLEVAIRLFVEKHPGLKAAAKKFTGGRHKKRMRGRTICLGAFKEGLRALGIVQGDIVIVHSGMQGLKSLDAAPSEIIGALTDAVGESGTIAFPVFPRYSEKDTLMLGEKKYCRYEKGRMPLSTGLLPFVFSRLPGVVISDCPFNPLAAAGAEATAMMAGNLDTDLAHGKGSCWDYCIQRRAKVLYLGIDLIEADTLLHAAEDMLDDRWPIRDWYVGADYYLPDRQPPTVHLRIRNGKWHKYFASFYSGRVLKKARLLECHDIGGFQMSLIGDSKAFTDFVAQRALKGKAFYFVRQKKALAGRVPRVFL